MASQPAAAATADTDDADEKKEAMRLRAPAATKMTTPHTITVIDEGSKGTFKATRHDIFSDSPLSDATYGRYATEQKRLSHRLHSLDITGATEPYVHGLTMKLTDSNVPSINAIEQAFDPTAHTVGYLQAELKLLDRYQTNGTVPVYIDPSAGYVANRSLAASLGGGASEYVHRRNYADVDAIFREVRRFTTLMFLLSKRDADGNLDKSDFKGSKSRIPMSSSFLRLLNAGQTNNGFVFNKFKSAPSKSVDAGAYDDEADSAAFTSAKAADMCTRLNPLPSSFSKTLATDKRVEKVVIRTNRLWTSDLGTAEAEDTSRVISQYAYGSNYDVGVKTAGVFVFRDRAMYDDQEVAKWNLLYRPYPGPFAEAPDAVVLGTTRDFKNYIVLSCIHEFNIAAAADEAAPTFDANDVLQKCKQWWDEVYYYEQDMNLEEYIKRLLPESKFSDPKQDKNTDMFETILGMSSNHFETNSKLFTGDLDIVYKTIDNFRLWRRQSVLQGVSAQKATELKWFSNAFGVSLQEYHTRRALCGEAADELLVPKDPPVFGKDLKFGTMFINERMATEFGEQSGASAQSDSLLGKLYSETRVGVDAMKTAEQQLEQTKRQMDALWMLLARMSAVGILNTDSHLGNYMLTSYGEKDGSYYCKVIDFDPSLTTVFSARDLEETNPANPSKKEGWKPVYVLNVLLVMFTLAQDIGRAQLYELFKNAGRLPENASITIANRLETFRMAQFTDLVNETKQAIKNTPMETQSVPQKLLATSWGGGYRGAGKEASLKLPLMFFTNNAILQIMFDIAFYTNAMSAYRTADKEKTLDKLPRLYAEQISKFEQYAKNPRTDATTISGAHSEVVKGRIEKMKAIAKSSELLYPPPKLQDAVKVIMKLDKKVEFSVRKPDKKQDPEPAEHLVEMQWAIRTNLSWRGFFELAALVHYNWASRQHLVNFALSQMIQKRSASDRDTEHWFEKHDASPLSSSQEIEVLSQLPPLKKSKYHEYNSFFLGDYANYFSKIMHHMTRLRSQGFSVMDLLYEYIYTQAPLRPTGPGKEPVNIRPRFPPKFDTDDPLRRPPWQTWPTQLPDDNRRILSILPVHEEDEEVPTGDGGEAMEQ